MDERGLSNKFNFILKKDGEGFGIEYDRMKLVQTDKDQITQGSSTFLEWVDITHENYVRDHCGLWKLQPHLLADKQNYRFILCLRYGEKPPRLVPNVLNPPVDSRVIASTNASDGYCKEACVMWDIVKSK